MKSFKQELILELLSRKDKLTPTQVAKEIHLGLSAASAHLRRLEAAGKVHVSEWRKGASRKVPNKCYSLGYGESVQYVSPCPRPKPVKPKASKEPVENVDLYMAKNRAQIISHDNRLSHADHIRFMSKFIAQPDPAAAWLFHEPRVELQGNKHDQL